MVLFYFLMHLQNGEIIFFRRIIFCSFQILSYWKPQTNLWSKYTKNVDAYNCMLENLLP